MTLDSLKLKNEIDSLKSHVVENYSKSADDILMGIGLVKDYIEECERKHSLSVDKFLESWE